MGNNACGAQDSKSFKAQLRGGHIPDQTKSSLTYEGVFNEHYFSIDPETKNLLSLECAYAISNNLLSLKDKTVWAACFLKSKKVPRWRTDIHEDGGTPPSSMIVTGYSRKEGGALNFSLHHIVSKDRPSTAQHVSLDIRNLLNVKFKKFD